MEKMTICLRRRSDLTPEAFRQHWRDIHAPIVVALGNLDNFSRAADVRYPA